MGLGSFASRPLTPGLPCHIMMCTASSGTLIEARHDEALSVSRYWSYISKPRYLKRYLASGRDIHSPEADKNSD